MPGISSHGPLEVNRLSPMAQRRATCRIGCSLSLMRCTRHPAGMKCGWNSGAAGLQECTSTRSRRPRRRAASLRVRRWVSVRLKQHCRGVALAESNRFLGPGSARWRRDADKPTAGTAAFRNDCATARFSNQRMSSNPNAPVRAAVLSATLTFEPRPADPFELRVPVIRRVMPRVTPPLDFDATYFRYRIDGDGGVHVLAAIAGARVCRAKSRRRRTRSAARS